jgi:HEAT repeat protein
MGLVRTSAFELGPRGLHSPTARRTIVDALTELLSDDFSVWADLPGAWATGHPEYVRLLMEAAVATGRQEAASLLVDLAVSQDVAKAGLTSDVLRELARYAEARPWAFRADPRPAARRLHAHEDWRVRRVALAASASLHDAEALDAMIAALDDGQASVRRAAELALHSLTGSTSPEGSAGWRSWKARQVAWWRDVGEEHLRALEDGDLERATTAMRELGGRPVFRDPVRSALERALWRDDVAIAVAAARTLQSSGYAESVPALADLLYESDEQKREAAWHALRTLTGADLPPDPARWEQYVQG